MRLTTVEQVVKHSSNKCTRTACKNRGAIHWHPHNRAYYCLTCVKLIEACNDFPFEKPVVKCDKCETGELRFIAPHVACCESCYKKTELPTHINLVKAETKVATDSMLNNIRGLNEYLDYSEKWQEIFDLISTLQVKVGQL